MASFLHGLFKPFLKKEIPKTRIPPKGPSILDYPFEIKPLKTYYCVHPVFAQEEAEIIKENEIEEPKIEYADVSTKTEEIEIKKEKNEQRNFARVKHNPSFDISVDGENIFAPKTENNEEEIIPKYKFSFYKGESFEKQKNVHLSNEKKVNKKSNDFVIKHKKNPVEKTVKKENDEIKFIYSKNPFSFN